MTVLPSGSGPGGRTPDGCSVELYRRLPYLGDLQDIEAELRRFSASLELGCGTGRLCLRLQQLGLQATGVDESAEMLAHLPPGVAGIQSTIEALNAGRRWPAVLLPSHLINHPDWTQTFTARSLEQPDIESLLAACGFGRFRWLGARALWVAAELVER